MRPAVGQEMAQRGGGRGREREREREREAESPQLPSPSAHLGSAGLCVASFIIMRTRVSADKLPDRDVYSQKRYP